MSEYEPRSNIEAFRQLALEWDEGKREIRVLRGEDETPSDIPPDDLTSLTLGDIWKLIRKGWLTDGDVVWVWEIEHKKPDGTTYYKNPPRLSTLAEVRARIRLLRH